MKRKLIITILTITVLLVGLFACGKADDIEPVMSSAIETDDQQEVEEENIVAEVENIIEEEPEQEVEEVDTVGEDDTTSLDNGAGEQITTQEEDYFKEAEELWEIHSDELSCNWETFREAYSTERQTGSTKDEALETMLDLFKKQEESQKQTSSKTQNTTETQQPAESSQNSTSSSNKSLDEKLAELGLPPQQDMPTAEKHGVSGTVDWGNITAQ